MPASSSPERLQILEMIESGAITPAQGLKLLQALGKEGDSEALEAAGPAALLSEPPSRETAPDPEAFRQGPDWNGFSHPRWRLAGQLVLGLGISLAILGGFFIYRTSLSPNPGFWFYCSWVPLLLGLGMTALAWYGRTARWLHIRIQQKPGERPDRIAISLPIPLGLTSWALRAFGRFIPVLKNTGLDELIQALEAETAPGPVLLADVTEGENGERVQVYLG